MDYLLAALLVLFASSSSAALVVWAHRQFWPPKKPYLPEQRNGVVDFTRVRKGRR